MSDVRIIAENKNCKAIDIGSLDNLNDYEFHHPIFKDIIIGRLFVGELLETSGSEISFRDLPARSHIPFLHKHHVHEEVYVFLKGYGRFQADDDVFKIKEGSIVRISPEGSRTLSNDSESSMIYMVIQSRADSLAGYNISDGLRSEGKIKV